MTGNNVIVIPAKTQVSQEVKRQLRVAAYCRVSTDDEEQLTSYEAQRTAYTDKIMSNPDWTMAGIFADEGITGTSARKRPEFLRMIRQCKQKKIDLILTNSSQVVFSYRILFCFSAGNRCATTIPGDFLLQLHLPWFALAYGFFRCPYGFCMGLCKELYLPVYMQKGYFPMVRRCTAALEHEPQQGNTTGGNNRDDDQ